MRLKVSVVEDEEAFIQYEIHARKIWLEMRRDARWGDDAKRPELEESEIEKDELDGRREELSRDDTPDDA